MRRRAACTCRPSAAGSQTLCGTGQDHAPAEAGLRKFLRHARNAEADPCQRDEQIVRAELDLRLQADAVLLEILLNIGAGARLALEQDEREGRDLLKRVGVVKITVVIRRGDEDLVGIEAVADGIGVLVLRLAGKGDVDLPRVAIVEDHLARAVEDADLDGRIVLMKGLEPGDQIGLRYRVARRR